MAKEKKEKKAAEKKPVAKTPTKKAPLPALPKPKAAVVKVPKPTSDAEVREPVLVEQLNERGEMEQVDFNLYCNIITCAVPGCGNVRYVKNADRHQVTMCKPCARRARRRRIRENRKARGKVSNFVDKKKEAKKAAKK
jgi:hypothetical protein